MAAQDWLSFVWLLLLLAAMGGLAALLRQMRMSELRKLSIRDDAEVERLSVELLEYVKQKSYEPGRVVDVRPFWKGRRLTAGDMYLVQMPLHESEVLLVMRETGFAAEIMDKLLGWVTIPLPDHVVLNPQEWHRMTHGGVSSTTILAENVDMRQIRRFTSRSMQRGMAPEPLRSTRQPAISRTQRWAT